MKLHNVFVILQYQWLNEVPSNIRLSPPVSGGGNKSARPVRSDTTVRTDSCTGRKSSRQVCSDTTLCSAKAQKCNNQTKPVKSCDTVSVRSGGSVVRKSSCHSQVSCAATTNKISCLSCQVSTCNAALSETVPPVYRG